MAEGVNENSHIPEVTRASFEVKQGDGVSSLGTKLGIRESFLQEFNNSGDIRDGDKFALKMKSDGTGTLIRNRGNATKEVSLSREAIFQDIEQGPAEFPYINFLRVNPGNYYILVNTAGESLGNVQVSSANLDQFKKEITKISGALITECGARKAQNDLACSIKIDGTIGPNVFSLNSNKIYDFIPSNIDISSLMRLTKSNDGKELIKHLASSLPLK